MNKEQKMYLNALNIVTSLDTLHNLWAFFKDDFKAAWHASRSELTQAGLSGRAQETIQNGKKHFDPEREWRKVIDANIETITLFDNIYPRTLKEIYNPPLMLYARGDITLLNTQNILAIVGTRKMTDYGRQVTWQLTKELVHFGITTVSGLARGIDSIVHETTLEYSGTTIAVLGTSAVQQEIYPPRNRKLAQKIVNNGGVLVSEFPIGTSALAQNFPRRNRIISGLSRGVLVVEAAIKSGALITARLALEQNREVFVVPGNIFSPMSEGTNYLAKHGAHIVSDVYDILEPLHIETAKTRDEGQILVQADNECEAQILRTLYAAACPLHVDEIIKIVNTNTSDVIATLMKMEIQQKIRNLGNSKFVIATYDKNY